MPERVYKVLHPILAAAGFGLWAFLLLQGRELSPTTTFAMLMLILACAGFAQLASDLLGVVGGGDGGRRRGGGGGHE